jgi:uncharacterized membrane protein (Fun14 family)
VWILGLLEDLFGFITNGSIGGLPTILVMLLPFILGLIVGYLVHKFLKFAIIAAFLLIIASYLGFFGLSLGALSNLATQYGPAVIHYGALLIGMLPLGLGFIVGLVIGFIFG